jgi:membrane protease subunit HflC
MKRINLIISGIVLVFFLATLSLFTVNEGEGAILLRLGQIVSCGKNKTACVYGPGLHLKLPFFDHVRILDTRLQELSTSSLQPLTVVTKEQTYLVVDYFARWRITNLAKFYTSTGGGNVHWAETLLEQRINDIVRAEYGKRTSDQAISADRSSMMTAIKEQANYVGKDQGIYVLDVRIQQITLPKDVMDSVFKRMATERKQFAEAKRAEGVQKSEEIKALADQRVTVIKAEALMNGAVIRAKGNEQAGAIYSKAYSSDPRFYAFYRSLEAYQNSFQNKDDILVLKPDGQFFTYFHQSGGSSANAKTK